MTRPPARETAKRSSAHAALKCVVLVCCTITAYWPALRGGMLWDDDQHVTSRAMQGGDGLRRIWFEPGATQQYYPLLHTAFWVEHRMWGDAMLGYHLLNLLLHAGCALLVVALARRLALRGAWLAGFVFVLHPVCVESVAWISEQKTTLSAIFCLGAALAYLAFEESRAVRMYAAACGLFALALLTKTVTAMLPVALLAIVWWRRGKLEWKRDVLPLAPWLAVGAAAGLVTASIERTSIGARGAEFDLGAAERVLVAGRALWFYLAKIVCPVNLMFTYPRWTPDAHTACQYLYPAGIVALAAALVVVARRGRLGPLAGFLIFAAMLFPVLGFLNVYPFRFSFVADHFQYLACLGILVPVAAWWPADGKNRPSAPQLAVVAVLGVLTFLQAGQYSSAETLYRATLARNPASWMAEVNLCALMLDKPGGTAEAIQHCQAALRLKPDYAEAHNDLGSAWARTPERLADAITEFRAALAAKPDFAEAHFNLANAMARIPGRQVNAIAEYEAALRIRPEYLEAHMNLGTVLARTPDRLGDAVEQYRVVLRLNPNLAEAHNNLGSALAQMPGRLEDAMAEYRAALEIDPQYAKAHNNLGSLLAQTPGRLMDAIGECRAAIRANPDYADAHYNLGVALAKAGRTEDAVAEFETVLSLVPGSVKTHYNLGVLLMRIEGRQQEALAHFQVVLRANRDPDLQRLVNSLQMKQRTDGRNGSNGHMER